MRAYEEDLSPTEVSRRRDPAVSSEGVLELQRTAGNQATVQFLDEAEERSPVLDVVGKGGGAPMDKALRTQMESRLGHDFGDVRVHTDSSASESAKAVGAHAYTVGNDIVFGSGKYDPGSTAGQKTIAHELTHVVQQKAGPVDGTAAPGGIRVSDPGDRYEQEADSTAELALQRQVGGEEEEMDEEESAPTP
jgi:Domain of unknown function (DUF4157)